MLEFSLATVNHSISGLILNCLDARWMSHGVLLLARNGQRDANTVPTLSIHLRPRPNLYMGIPQADTELPSCRNDGPLYRLADSELHSCTFPSDCDRALEGLRFLFLFFGTNANCAFVHARHRAA